MIFYSSALTDLMWVCGLQEPSKLHSRTYVPLPVPCLLVYMIFYTCFQEKCRLCDRFSFGGFQTQITLLLGKDILNHSGIC